jgi:hypothetical protein
VRPNPIGNMLYNLDRTIASLVWGTSQYAISSKVGRIAGGDSPGEPIRRGAETKAARWLARWLDHAEHLGRRSSSSFACAMALAV